ncbi:MAG: stage 0 sporulation family protein, partial [Chloroflexota bacterium]|nr:stage 0 sporulation family protein [Chloroflexota bacterium]
IRFKKAGKIYYFDPTGFEDLGAGNRVVVETARGQEVGQIVTAPREVPCEEITGKLKGILRRATAWDLSQMEYYRLQEKEALEKCRQKVAKHGLPMKVLTADYNFDGSHLTFYFAAEKRVDFRSLVRELAGMFQARIELRQVGVRDEVKLIDGYGVCGRPLCCATFLTEFRPISIKMAKQQNLPLSPSEISGQCGRLLCCLSYENETYVEIKKKLPRVGENIQTPQGPGKVISVNVIKETLDVVLEESEIVIEVSARELQSSPNSSVPPPRSRRKRRRR